MARAGKRLSLVFVFIIMLTYSAYADNQIERNPPVETGVSAEVEIEEADTVNKIVGQLETFLDPENDELEKEVTETLEQYSENWLVKIFKRIIDALNGFLDELFKLATEAAKVGVD